MCVPENKGVKVNRRTDKQLLIVYVKINKTRYMTLTSPRARDLFRMDRIRESSVFVTRKICVIKSKKI